jgi:MYXO-CTERM domain-containing protein
MSHGLLRSRIRSVEVACIVALAFASTATLGCSEDSESEQTAENDGAIRGTLVMYAVTLPDGTSRTEYALRINGDERVTRQLLFAEDPGLEPWTRLKVWGAENDGRIQVRRFEIEPAEPGEVGATRQGLIGAAPLSTRKIALVLYGGGGTILGSDVVLGQGPGSLRGYYFESSYGMQDLLAKRFEKPGLGQVSCASYLAQASAHEDFPGYDHYIIGVPGLVSGFPCNFPTAELGTPAMPGRYSWYPYNALDVPVTCDLFVRALARNFGLQASSLNCGDVPLKDDPTTCTAYTYDPLDPTGGTTGTFISRKSTACYHNSARQKAALGWLSGCNGVRVRASGTYNLLPLEIPCDGPQVLQIPMPRERSIRARSDDGGLSGQPVRFYYLELRTSTGLDRELPTTTPTVLVRIADDFTAAGLPASDSWLLNMAPGGQTWNGLQAGQSFADPAGGVTFKVQSIAQSGAKIEVTMAGASGTSTCLDDSPFVAPGSGACSAGGTGGTGGAAGTSGTGAGGAGAAGGTGGAEDAGSTGGTSGASGTSANGGTGFGGTVGAGAAAGTTQAGGTRGMAGSNPGAGGAVGSDTGGSAGTRAGSSATDPGLEAAPVEGRACGCRSARPGNGSAFGLLLGLAMIALGRRQRLLKRQHESL